MPKVLNKRTDNIPAGAVYVGRPTKWGNPFAIDKYDTRPIVVEKYRQYIQRTSAFTHDLLELRGKDLVCWCSPLPCHADILLELANQYNNSTE